MAGGSAIQKQQPGKAEHKLYFYHPDHLGSTGYVTDEFGAVYQHLQYFPFGETWTEEASNTDRIPYLFTGKELDEETGLYYFGARYYDPRASLWVSVDPILGDYLSVNNSNKNSQNEQKGSEKIFRSATLNLYAYVVNRPLIAIDPDGRFDVKIGIDINNELQQLESDAAEFGVQLPFMEQTKDWGAQLNGLTHYSFKKDMPLTLNLSEKLEFKKATYQINQGMFIDVRKKGQELMVGIGVSKEFGTFARDPKEIMKTDIAPPIMNALEGAQNLNVKITGEKNERIENIKTDFKEQLLLNGIEW